jgi:hypothetical protein
VGVGGADLVHFQRAPWWSPGAVVTRTHYRDAEKAGGEEREMTGNLPAWSRSHLCNLGPANTIKFEITRNRQW